MANQAKRNQTISFICKYLTTRASLSTDFSLVVFDLDPRFEANGTNSRKFRKKTLYGNRNYRLFYQLFLNFHFFAA